jgi:aminoglycoside 2'-N-acetyltransferase I
MVVKPPLSVTVSATERLTDAEQVVLRRLMDLAFAGNFDDTDWDHALGGVHAIGRVDGVIVAHAALVERTLYVDEVPMASGYVEAVATHPEHQGRGYGTAVMRALLPDIERIGFGALATGEHAFYERLGWQRWQGPTYVRGRRGFHRSADEDDAIMVLTVPGGAAPSLGAALACENRPGDAW